jgi:hypothetical protein
MNSVQHIARTVVIRCDQAQYDDLLNNIEGGTPMSLEFSGSAQPLDKDGMSEVTDKLGVGPAEVWAVLTVETHGCGFLPDRRPFILYERHIFSRETDSRFDAAHPDISNRTPGGYGAGGANQYDRLGRAIALDRPAALRSTSWGIGQVMGFNAGTCGYAEVEDMVAAMCISERDQLLAMAREIIHNGIDKALRNHDWARFARLYNGPAYEINKYDTLLAAAYGRFSAGSLPDYTVRAGQIYLGYLGYHPGTVDGIMGRLSRSALHEFQENQGLPLTNEINAEVLSNLKEMSNSPASDAL